MLFIRAEAYTIPRKVSKILTFVNKIMPNDIHPNCQKLSVSSQLFGRCRLETIHINRARLSLSQDRQDARHIHHHFIENSDFVCFEIRVKYLTRSETKPLKVIIAKKLIT